MGENEVGGNKGGRMKDKEKEEKIILILEDSAKLLFQMSKTLENMALFFEQEFKDENHKHP